MKCILSSCGISSSCPSYSRLDLFMSTNTHIYTNVINMHIISESVIKTFLKCIFCVSDFRASPLFLRMSRHAIVRLFVWIYFGPFAKVSNYARLAGDGESSDDARSTVWPLTFKTLWHMLQSSCRYQNNPESSRRTKGIFCQVCSCWSVQLAWCRGWE